MSRLLRADTLATIGISLVLFGTMPGCTESRSGPLVALDLEIKENTIDGCTACGCRARGEGEPGVEPQWWMTFGLVASDSQGGWEAPAGHTAVYRWKFPHQNAVKPTRYASSSRES